MLFIYRVLPMGGVETFFLRMAKERHRLGKHTSILLLSEPKASNPELLSEISTYAQVLHPSDLFSGIPVLMKFFPLLAPISTNKINIHLSLIDQIHVFHGIHALLGYRLNKILKKNLPISIGFYHYIRYLWGGDDIPHHEKVNREFIFNYLPDKSLIFFSEGSRKLYSKHKGLPFSKSNTFSLGVVDKKNVGLLPTQGKALRIVSVGRLINFKTYNMYMIDVVRSLLDQGFEVSFDIFGDGPLRKDMMDKIIQLGVANNVSLKGRLDYLKFDKTISNYDMFIGSGTAVVQASALGLPSIVGVENVISSKSYGYFSNVCHLQYNRKGLEIPLISVEKLILDYINLDYEGRCRIRNEHVNSIVEFTNESCQKSMDMLREIVMPNDIFQYNKYIYTLSYVLDMVHRKFSNKHPRNRQFDDFISLSEGNNI